MYAATATFYECLTGRPPFVGNTAEMLLHQHQVEPVPLEPVPVPLRPLVEAGMAKEPQRRPTDGTSFVAALHAAAVGEYGPDWEERGRSHLGEAALLLAALWPSGDPPAVGGFTVEEIPLWQRRSRMIKVAFVAAVVIVVAAAGTALAATRLSHATVPSQPAAPTQHVSLQATSMSPSPSLSLSPTPFCDAFADHGARGRADVRGASDAGSDHGEADEEADAQAVAETIAEALPSPSPSPSFSPSYPPTSSPPPRQG